jgi:hypothetical protein
MIKLTKVVLFVFLICFSSFISKSQYFENPQKKSSFTDKLFFGGGLGLQFGQVTQIEITPIVGYRVTNRFHVGVSGTYSFYKDQTYTNAIQYSTYGGSTFLRFFIIEGLFAHTEAEFLNVEVFDFTSQTTYTTHREWIQNYLVGGGYFQKIGEKSGMFFEILWNLNETELTPYSNPVMRIGFSF